MKRSILFVYRYRIPIYYAAGVLLIALLVAGKLGIRGTIPLQNQLAIGALITLAVCAILSFTVSTMLPVEDPQTVASPVRGRWLGMNSPQTKVPSHGIRAYGQAYAIDLCFEPEGATRPDFGGRTPARSPNEYPAFGEPVYAMIDGIVMRSSDWRRDHLARSNWFGFIYMMIEGMIREIGGPGFIVGNHIVIRRADGVHALVAHLQRGSALVKTGDQVVAGQQIGRCGNSGNTTEPHVHAQLMDRASTWTGQGVPMKFARITLDETPGQVDSLPSDDQHMEA